MKLDPPVSSHKLDLTDTDTIFFVKLVSDMVDAADLAP